MSVKNTGRKNTVWDIEIVERTNAWQSPIATACAAFDEHKEILLDKLRNGYKLGLKSDPFDANQSWRGLTQLAKLYFSERIMKQETMVATDCVKRLGQLERALRKARNLVDRAMRDDVGADLFRAWLGVEQITKDAPINLEGDHEKTSSFLIRAADGMKEAVAGLATLETAARAATVATDVLSKEGRPALLPKHCIQGLARVYRKSTGAKPGRGAGPFAEFAYEFMTAVGQTGFEYESLIDAIQDAHRLFKPSWFDEKT
jgi:hypothetical protein